jgi:hypothetical protein
MESGAWVYDCATLSLGDINTWAWSSRFGVGRKADNHALLKKYCCVLQRSENQMINLAESSKEDCGSKRAVLLMMMTFLTGF